ncbi:MAG TPA: DUF2330 domain-containing protein [Candidatus Dormibacteraeota bacterium]|nr:DUF2330 domain-containing protein [Candidatus Dormibacteraeota bacterium]
MLRVLGALATAVLAVSLSASAVAACGAMVSPTGANDRVQGFDAMISFDGSREQVLTQVAYNTPEGQRPASSFGWLMPLPAAPEVARGDIDQLDIALAITTPPDPSAYQFQPFPGSENGAGAPATGGVEVIGSATVGPLQFVTLQAGDAAALGRWLVENGYAWKPGQQPAIQRYLDQGWVIEAARAVPDDTGASTGAVGPIRFTFPSTRLVYPMALLSASPQPELVSVRLLLLTPYRPVSTSYAQADARFDGAGYYQPSPDQLDLLYSAPLGAGGRRAVTTHDAAGRIMVPSHPWLTRYEATWRSSRMTKDLSFARSAKQDPITYAPLINRLQAGENAQQARFFGLLLGLPLVVLLAIAGGAVWLLMRRRRRPSA